MIYHTYVVKYDLKKLSTVSPRESVTSKLTPRYVKKKIFLAEVEK